MPMPGTHKAAPADAPKARAAEWQRWAQKGKAMRITKYLYMIALILIVNFLVAVQAKELYQKNVFSISLPDGWVEMPADVIDAYEKEMAKLVPNDPAPHYDYGFQLGSTENWFDYPYILVQIDNIGRISKNQIEQLDGYSVQEDLNKYKNNLSPVMSDIQAGKMYYDSAAKIIWLHIESIVTEAGPISGLSGMIPTEKGFIQVNGLSLSSDYSTYEPIFRASTMSVAPNNELVYKPRSSSSLPPVANRIDLSQVAGKAIVGTIIGGLIVLLAVFRRKKKQ